VRRKIVFDSNIALCLLIGDEVKADRAEALLADDGTIGVQVLNEFVAVARRRG
jgi:predicted nucleic acid-binding protein